MKNISILNDVLGPVMRGPSSSHTAGSYHLAALARSLLGEVPVEAEFQFDARGSYSRCYRQQGSDLAFAAGLLGWAITDERFPRALEMAPQLGLAIRFETGTLAEADHPNSVRIEVVGARGRRLSLMGKSVGGGAVQVTRLDGWPVLLDGSCYEVLVATEVELAAEVADWLMRDGQALAQPIQQVRGSLALLQVRRKAPLGDELRQSAGHGVQALWHGEPLMFVKCGPALFEDAARMVAAAEERGVSAGQIGAAYEARLLGLTEVEVLEEMGRRYDVMATAVRAGLDTRLPPLQLLQPTAGRIYAAEANGRLAVGGLHTRAAARAMAAMHVNCGMGVVCAAPTAGSAGVLPGVLVTLHDELVLRQRLMFGLGATGSASAASSASRPANTGGASGTPVLGLDEARGYDRATIARCLLAAGMVGVIVAERATFAAEVAGCQVEIGAAGAMAAAAVVEAAGGTARQAADAAAVCFQNTMGSVCDLVQGIVEIPCHTRNAVAASSAFVVADLVLGGYHNPIPLDETIDAVYEVGRMLPAELRVTSLGGLAATPSARALPRLR
jgi:L-serine dehydratase